jgi:putative addiction module antidote
MPIQFKMKLARVGNSLRVTIPKPVADGMRLREGDTLAISVTDSEIRIRKLKEAKR